MRPAGPMHHDDLTDVAGLRVGHHQRTGPGWRTGTTVVLCPPGTVGGVDVRGGGPGTRETDLLEPHRLVHEVHAVVLTGGSAYGLAAAQGVMDHLAGRGVGLPVGTDPAWVVPIVPAAVIFDLGRGGRFDHRPDASFGARAAAAATARRGAGPVAQGSVGAGTGARAGGLAGGVGSASLTALDGAVTVAALVVVNALGSVVDERTGRLRGADRLDPAGPVRVRRPPRAEATALAAHLAAARPAPAPLNTTIGVVATDADLTKAECTMLASVAHDGLARAVHPAHGMADGDTFFSLATGTQPLGPPRGTPVRLGDPAARHRRLDAVLAAAADAVTRAVVHAVVHATGWPDLPAYRTLAPGAVARPGPRR